MMLFGIALVAHPGAFAVLMESQTNALRAVTAETVSETGRHSQGSAVLRCMWFTVAVLASVGAFALSHGVIEYRIACTSLWVSGDGWRERTPHERRARFTEAVVEAVPAGVKAVGLLIAPLWVVARVLRRAPRPVGYAVGGGCGCASGAALSIAVYAVVGGWAAPLFYEAVVAAVVLTTGLVSIERVKE